MGEEWELNDEEVVALDLQGVASLNEVEGTLPDKNAEEMAREGFYFYLVKSMDDLRMRRPGSAAQHFFCPMGI